MKHLTILAAISWMLILATAQTIKAQTKEYKPNPTGYLVERYGVTQEQEDRINWFSYLRSTAIDSLSTLGLPQDEYRRQRDSVTDIYYERVRTVLTPEQQARFNPEALKAARAGEVKILKLPVEKEIAMGALKAEYEKSLKATDGQPYKEMKAQRAAIEAEYRENLRGLLGEEKYGEWLKYKNGATARKFKNQFGFTESQYEQYKGIEKWQAVQILVIKNTAVSPEERVQKIEETKQAKVDSLRAVLPEEQFGKWYDYYQRKEAQRAAQNNQ